MYDLAIAETGATLTNAIFKLEAGNTKIFLNPLDLDVRVFRIQKNQCDIIKEVMKVYQGGMGSFSDLVLHKNGKMLIDEKVF